MTEVVVMNQEDLEHMTHQVLSLRELTVKEWIQSPNSSGTLKTSHLLGMAVRKHALEELVHFVFGGGFYMTPSTYIQTGVPFSEGDCAAVTETGWYVKRLMAMHPLEKFKAAYLTVDTPEGRKEGLGVVVTQTPAKFVPEGYTVYAIIAEWDPVKKSFKEAENPC